MKAGGHFTTKSGFTLVEILVVVGLISALLAMGVLATKGSWQSQEVRASALKLATDLTMASQLAMKMNKPVQVRFYLFGDPAIASDQPQYRGYQLLYRDYQLSANGKVLSVVRPVSAMERFAGTTVMASYKNLSSLAGLAMGGLQAGDPDLGIGPYGYVAVEFRPDGSTNLANTEEPWTVTLVSAQWLVTQEQPPRDFQCIGIDWRNGAATIY